MKKIFLIIIFIGVIFTISGCNTKNEIIDALKFKEEYESLNGTTNEKNNKTFRTINIKDNNPFIYKEASDIVDMINNKETFIVYFGFAECPWCRSVIPTLIDVASDLEVDKIYYVDIKNIRDTLGLDNNLNVITKVKGTNDYYALLELLKEILDDYNLIDENGNAIATGEKRIYAPSIISIINGEAKKLETGISDKQTDGNMELTEEMKNDTYNKFKTIIEYTLKNNTTCSISSKC